MKRFYIEHIKIENNSVRIPGAEARHILKVLRLKKNDGIQLFDKNGNMYSGVIKDYTQKDVTVGIRESRKYEEQRTSSEIILGQAVIKGKKMDYFFQKSTELGVTKIIPFFSERSVPRWDGSRAAQRVEHWQKIVNASVKQSGVRPVPMVEEIKHFPSVVRQNLDGYLKLIFWENEKKENVKSIISSQGLPSKIICVIGPEGGFSENEINIAKDSGFVTVGLGDQMLRSETVSLAILTIFQYERGEFGK